MKKILNIILTAISGLTYSLSSFASGDKDGCDLIKIQKDLDPDGDIQEEALDFYKNYSGIQELREKAHVEFILRSIDKKHKCNWKNLHSYIFSQNPRNKGKNYVFGGEITIIERSILLILGADVATSSSTIKLIDYALNSPSCYNPLETPKLVYDVLQEVLYGSKGGTKCYSKFSYKDVTECIVTALTDKDYEEVANNQLIDLGDKTEPWEEKDSKFYKYRERISDIKIHRADTYKTYGSE